jgi:pimeloyl-ACP methyl ester carboxylesterase
METNDLQYSTIPPRAAKVLEHFFPDEKLIEQRLREFPEVAARPEDGDGDVEVLDGVEFTHRFVVGPGDKESVRFHYVETGDPADETIVFLHGIPDSWFQWVHQMSALSTSYHCVGVDLKGYGQSEKTPGDFRHEAAAEQLVAALEVAGISEFNLVTHDRGTVQGDYIAARQPEKVLRYGRGEQHLHHFHPDLAPQGPMFAEAPRTGMMDDPRRFVIWLYTWLCKWPVSDEEIARTVQEYSYPDVNRAVPRYFNSSTFRQEWIDRRESILAAWTCPVMIMQGYESKSQPREFYEAAREYIPNAKSVDVEYIDAGHFWTLEKPDEVTDLIRKLLTR